LWEEGSALGGEEGSGWRRLERVGKKGALFIAERSGAAEVVGTGVGWVRYRC
jgi:hypothetical protein